VPADDLYTFSNLTAPDPKALPDFSPAPRFGTTTFAQYDPQHPSQSAALKRTQAFVKEAATGAPKRRFWQKAGAGKGLYMDGGFGVGKTHLLAAAYTAFGGRASDKAYMSFSELVHAIGVLGSAGSKESLGGRNLYCIDEFELDDPGNTLIVRSFLEYVFEQGGAVMTTSNTAPEAQGEGRFNASDFKREIQNIAERFDVLQIGGPDYRKRKQLAELSSEAALETLLLEETPTGKKVSCNWADLFAFLQSQHPIRYSHYLKQIGILYVHGVTPIDNQNDALRFVHFIDKLYDLQVGLRMSGQIELVELFDASYRDGAYAKKHYRCLSRISELFEEISGSAG